MSAMAFDTCTAAKRLRDAGFNEHQADAAVTMVRGMIGADQEARATKADVGATTSGLESRLTARMDALATRMDTFATKADFAAFETRLTYRLYAVFLAAVAANGIIAAALKAL